MSDQKQAEFQGAERFMIQRSLGAGGFGVVYEAYDRERNATVALKSLPQGDAEALYRFKQEFRCLADITHPNLVTLYELIVDGEEWFFTMELVEGVDFLNYVRGSAHQPVITSNTATDTDDNTDTRSETIISVSPNATDTNATDFNEDVETRLTPNPGVYQTLAQEMETIKLRPADQTNSNQPVSVKTLQAEFRLDPARLRATLRQLAAGIAAIHAAGKLHRDIKPSNVLVTAAGRVVILDFGIATELTSPAEQDLIDIVGTPAYMSPEQGAGHPLTEASDWYSVGVMLYEALTGKRPFTGQVATVLANKQRFEATPPGKLVKDIPPDLDLLCQQLLRRDPKERPLGMEILARLGISESAGTDGTLGALPLRAAPFVGREEYLAILQDAFNTTKRERRTATVYIQGRSGMGKSALVRHFLEELREVENELVVLSGRCYEQESVPYKAFDSLVDALSHYLKQLSAAEVAALVTEDLPALVRLFPVLNQVSTLAVGRLGALAIPDTRELRRRAFTALRELFTRLAERVPLILYIDDLQWGDLDSVAILSELLRPPAPPPFLLITTFRSEDVNTSPILTTFLPMRATNDATIAAREIVIKELSARESQELAIALLGKEDSELLARAKRIAQESKGNPFFVDELVRYSEIDQSKSENYLNRIDNSTLSTRPTTRAGESAEDSGITRLDQVIQARVLRLPSDARRLLEVVAVAGQPLERAIAKQAAELSAHEQDAFALLRANRMIRVTGTSQQEQIETYHDRIRETVVAHLDQANLQGYHNRLATLLAAAGQTDPERLARHFHRAGNSREAAKYAVEAAAKAYSALAFDRAARFYQLALELRETEDAETHSLQVRLGDALANAGRGHEAAKIFLLATKTAKEVEALELRQRAADQLLRSGYLEQGFAELRIITDKVGIKIAPTPLRALVSFLYHRIKIHLRGLEYQERPAAEVAAEDLLKLDTFWSVSSGLSLIDATRGVELQARHLLFALQVGEPQRVARALAAETGYNASAGGRKAIRTEQLLKMTRELVERIQYPYGIALAASVAGIAAGCCGEWRRAIAEFARAETILRQQCTGVTSELDTGNYWTCTSLYFIGDFNQLFNRFPAALKDIQERGNLFSETNLRLRTTYIRFLANDDVENAREELQETIGRWSQPGFLMQHFWHLFGCVQTLLYNGEAAAAWQLINDRWPAVKRSFLLRIQSFYLQALHLRARCIAALMAQQGYDNGLAKIATRECQLLRKENMHWGNAFALHIEASLAAARGETEQAIRLAADTEAAYLAVDMELFATVLRRRRGELRGGDEGRELIARADQWMNGQQIRNPGAMAEMLAPGSWKLNSRR